MKKFLSVLLAVMMVVSTVSYALPTAVTVSDSAEDIYVPVDEEEIVPVETADLAAEDTWYDTTKGTLLFNMDFETDNSGNAVASTAYDAISLITYGASGAGELISGLGRLNPDVVGTYDVGFRYTTSGSATLGDNDGNKYLSINNIGSTSSNQYSMYIGGALENDGTYVIEVDYMYVKDASSSTTLSSMRVNNPVNTGNDSNVVNGEWATWTTTFDSTSGDYIRVMFNGNALFTAADKLYLDNVKVWYYDTSVDYNEKVNGSTGGDSEETVDEWANTAKGYKLFVVDFETKNDGTALVADDYSAITTGRADSSPSTAGVAASAIGRTNPNYTVNARVNIKGGSGAALAGTDDKYLTLTSSGDSLILSQLYVGDGTYVFEFETNTVAFNVTRGSYNAGVTPAAVAIDETWYSTTHTAEGVTEESSTSCSSYGTDNIRFHCSTAPTMYDNIVVYYQPTGWTAPESGEDSDNDAWEDETKGTKLFVIDLDGDTNYTTADLSKLANRIDGTSDNSDSNGLYAEAIGRVNPDYATAYANTFKYAFKDGGTPTVSGDTDKYFTHTATTNPSVMVANPFVGAGTYTLVFNHEAAKTFNMHSGYTGGTATTTTVDDTWAQTAYTIDISEQGANDYIRIIGTAGAGTYLIDDVALYYKNTAATVTVYSNGNANVADTSVTVNTDTGMTAAELVAKVDTSASTKELLGASLTADGAVLLEADYVIMPDEVTGIYLVWGDDIAVDEDPWWEDGLGTLLFDVNWDGTLATAEQSRWADVRQAGASTNPDWANHEKLYFMWGTEDIGGGSTWVPATSPLIAAEANGNRYYKQPHNSTYNYWSLYSTYGGDWAGFADGDGVFTISYKIKTIGDITVNKLFIDPQLVYNHATTRQDIRLVHTSKPDSSGWITVTYQIDTSEYTTSEGETLGHVLFYAQTNESSAVSGAYICYDDVQVYYKPSKVNVTMKPGTCLEVTETVVEASTAGVLASDLIALVDTQDTTLLPTGITTEDGTISYALTDTVVLDADTTFVITWEENEWMDDELGMLIQKADFEGTMQTTAINKWPAATALGATINPDYDFEGVTGLQFTVANAGIAFDESGKWIPADYSVTESGNTYFEFPTANIAYGATQQYTKINMYAMGTGTSQYQYQTAGTYTITGKVKYGSDISNAILDVRPNAFNGSGLTSGFNYQFTETVPGEWNEFSVTWSTAEDAVYGLGSVEFYLFYDSLTSASTIAYDDIMLYYKPFTAEVTLRANNNPVAKDIVLSDVSTSGITVEELLSNIRTPLGGMDLVGLAYDKAGTNMLEGTIVVGGDSRFFMIWTESELDPNAPVSENVNAIRTDDPIGMRFRAYMTTTVAGSATQIGWVVTRYDLLESAAINPYDFYLDTGVAKVTAYNKDTDVEKFFATDDVNTYITAVLYNIPTSHYETTLVARPFTVVDGVTYYGYPVERSICEVAEAIRDGGYAGCSNDQMTYIKSILEVCGKSTEVAE